MRSKHIIYFICACLLVGVVVYGFFIEPSRISIQHVEIEDHELGDIFAGITVVFISDLHISRIGRREGTLLRVLDEIKPDIILMGGDYVTWKGKYENALAFLSRINAKLGVWAVMGDYDYSNSRKSCLFCHEAGRKEISARHNVIFLRNSMDIIRTHRGNVWIGGIDSESRDIALSQKGLFFLNKNQEPVILLSHSPLIYDYIEDDRNILVLAGDTHGGQVPVPGCLWKLFGYKKNVKYEKGWFEKGKKRMYVSRGIGTSHFPFRFARAPEVTVFRFHKQF